MAAKNIESTIGHLAARNIFPARAIMPTVRREIPTFIIDLQSRKRIS